MESYWCTHKNSIIDLMNGKEIPLALTPCRKLHPPPANPIVLYTQRNEREPEIPGAMTQQLPKIRWKLIILVLVLLAVILFAWVTW